MRLVSRLTLVLLAVLGLCLPASRPAFATNTPQTLPFSQDWTNIGLITADDNWSGVPGIEGFRGDALTGATGANPQTLLASDTPGVLDVNANQTAPNTFTTGGVTEFHIANPVAALAGSGTADAPYIKLYLNTTGQTGITVSYNLRDIDGSIDDAVQQVALHFRVGGAGNFTDVPAAYVADASSANLATLVTPVCVVLPAAANNQPLVEVRVMTTNAAGNDEWIGVDDIVVNTAGCGGPPTTTLNVGDVIMAEGDPPGTTTFTFAVTLTTPAGAGGVTFDIATTDGTAQDDNPATEDNDYVAQSLTGQSIPMGSMGPYNFSVTVNRDLVAETNETFFVNVSNVVGATAGATPGMGTISNDDVVVAFIHDVQGNGAATPIPGSTVSVEGVVIGNYQGANKLSGFFLQEEDADADADPATSEGIFVFCSSCPTPVAEGQRVRATGAVSEFNNMTEITASTAGSVVVTNAGNNLALVTPSPVDLPIVGVVDDFYEAREGMKVTFIDTLTVSEYFELARFGHLELFEGGRPRQFTEFNTPSVAGYAAHLASLDRRRVVLDDDNNNQNASLTPFQVDGMQLIFHPQANGGFSVGTQGIDFFRGGDLVNGLTGVLHWSFPGVAPDTWRIRPTAANPAAFTVANPRPATPPNVGGAIKVVGMNLLNYFTTIDTTASSSTGPCAPGGTLDCRGADSNAELIRQRERASIVICTLNADVFGFAELENTTASASITDLLGAVNTRCGGIHPYTFVNTGGTLGTDAIRVQQIYRTGIVSPVGSPFSDLDPIHSRPPTAQTFDVVDATNPAFGQRFTVVVNHLKSKGSSAGLPGDADAGDGAGFSNATRTAQAARLLTWINGTVVPAAGDPDVILLGDFNAYAKEDPITTLQAGGYNDLETTFHGANAYSYLFDGQLGHLDYGLASASLLPQVTGADAWHINADEADLFDYNDEVRDSPGEAAFEEKPDGSALMLPRVLFQPASPYRASDHDPVVVGLFATADLAITKTDSPDPVTAGSTLAYTITVTNNGPDAAASASWSDTLPVGTTFASLPAVAGWTCTTGATVSCSNPSFGVGSAVFTLTVNVSPSVAAGSVLSNTATVTAATGDGTPGNNSATATTTVVAMANLSVTKTGTPDPVTAGTNLTYTITVTNAGPSDAASASWSDTLPAGTTFVSLPAVAGWSCTTGATVSCSNPSFGVGSAVFTLTVAVAPGTAAGTVLSNTATVSSATADPSPGNESATATTTVGASADLSVTKTDSPDPVTAGTNLTYTITVTNAGPSNAATVSLSDTLPAGTTFVSLPAVAGWTCTTGATVACSNPSFGVGSAVFTLTVAVAPGTSTGTVISNTATASSATTDPTPGNNSGTATTTVGTGSADLSVTKTDAFDPTVGGINLTYTLTVTNAGPSNATTASLSDTLPAGTTFVSLASPGGWSCTTPAVGSGGTVSCSFASLPIGSSVFTLTVALAPTTTGVISNTATVSSATTDPNPANDSDTETTTVGSAADLSVTKVDTPDPVTAGTNLTYTITANNAGPSNAPSASLTDTLPAGTTFVSLSSAAGWSCTTPAVGAGGTVTCTHASMPLGNAVFTLIVQVGTTVPNNTVLSNTAAVTSLASDLNQGNESSTATTTVVNTTPPVAVGATKTGAGQLFPGGSVTYTIVLTNSGYATQADNPGNEFTDVLPAGLTLVGATATSGTAVATVGTNTVTWNGAIPSGGSVTITINATVNAVTPGTTITNQGSVAFDGDGNGTNESSALTDDPGVAGGANPTSFVVLPGPVPATNIPTLDEIGLALLVLLLAMGGAVMLRRRRA